MISEDEIESFLQVARNSVSGIVRVPAEKFKEIIDKSRRAHASWWDLQLRFDNLERELKLAAMEKQGIDGSNILLSHDIGERDRKIAELTKEVEFLKAAQSKAAGDNPICEDCGSALKRWV